MVKWLFRLVLLSLLALSLLFSLAPVSASEPLAINDKVIHFLSYFALMLALDFSCLSGRYIVSKMVLVLSYSIAIEIAQSYVPGRDMSAYDALANGLGIMAFIAILPLIKMQKFYRQLQHIQDS